MQWSDENELSGRRTVFLESLVLRAFAAGTGIIFVVYWLWEVLPELPPIGNTGLPLTTFMILSPALAAFVASVLSPRRKIAIGLSMVIPAVLRPPSFLDFFYYKVVGFPAGERWGFKDTLLISEQYLITLYIPLCAIGAIAGWIIALTFQRFLLRSADHQSAQVKGGE